MINIIFKNFKLIKNKYVLNSLIIISFIILSFISIMILLHSRTLFRTADIQFHFRRVMELNESIKNGNILPDFSFNQFHGSAVMLLYPYLNMLPMVLLSFIIKSKIIVFYAFFMFNAFLTFIISFYSSNSYIKSYTTAYIFSIIYSFSNIILTHSFLSTDFGIVSSFTFFPLVMFGFINILRKHKEWFQLSLGMILIAFSHILNTFIIGMFLILWFLINLKRLDKIIILRILKSLILFIITTSIIWLPILNFYFNRNNVHMPEIMQLKGINIITLLSGIYGKKTPDNLGLFPLITIFIIPFFYKKLNYLVKQMYILSLMIVLAVLFFPWRLTEYGIFQVLNQIQFTFRFLIIPYILLNFLFALIITKYIKNVNKKLILYSLVILISLFFQLIGQYTIVSKHKNALPIDYYLNKNNKYIDLNALPDYNINDSSQFSKMMNAYSTDDDDYIPKSSVSISKYVNSNIGFYNYDHEKRFKRIGYNEFYFNGKKDIYRISLPIYMYNNEKLHVYLNNREINSFSDNNGMLTINNIENNIKSNNNIYIKPAFNIFRMIGLILTIIGLLFILFLFLKNMFIS